MTTHNLLIDTDSYKYSHWGAYPSELSYMQAYLEPRKPMPIRFFGLQKILMEWIETPITVENVLEAHELAALHFGDDLIFNFDGWMTIAKEFSGRLPLRIKAVPEGTVLGGSNILVKVENTDPRFPWLVTFFETQLMRVWYPTTVCTNSYNTKQLLQKLVSATTGEEKPDVSFMLHDFGARGTSSSESAGIGGLAHLVNFMGTDTVKALKQAKDSYGHEIAGFSVPALEHSTIMSWGVEREKDCYEHFIRRFGKPGKPIVIVVDTYNDNNAILNILGKDLKEMILSSGVLLKVRLDSGDPVESVMRGTQNLEKKFGSSDNGNGFKVLETVGVVQGNNVTDKSITNILTSAAKERYCATNYVFGQGGALLQNVGRDDNGFAYKPSLIEYTNGLRYCVRKNPHKDPFKASKGGDLDLVYQFGEGYKTIDRASSNAPYPSQLQIVYVNGLLKNFQSLNEIRAKGN